MSENDQNQVPDKMETHPAVLSDHIPTSSTTLTSDTSTAVFSESTEEGESVNQPETSTVESLGESGNQPETSTVESTIECGNQPETLEESVNREIDESAADEFFLDNEENLGLEISPVTED